MSRSRRICARLSSLRALRAVWLNAGLLFFLSACGGGDPAPGDVVAAQGRKEVFLGSDRYQYDPTHYLLATAELPVVSQVIEASPERPYLSLRLDLDPSLVSSVIEELRKLTYP